MQENRINNKIRAVIYARVSTDEQAKNGKASIPEQINKCQEIIELKGWKYKINPGIYKDDGYSGQTIDGCPAMKKLLKEAQENLFDVVAVYDFDRLRRDPIDSLLVCKELLKHGVQIYSINQPVEPDPPDNINKYNDARIISQTFGAMKSALDISSFRRKSKFGMENRVKVKRQMPHSTPYGYQIEYINKGILRPESIRTQNKIEVNIVKRIYDMYINEGFGDKVIAVKLNNKGIKPRRKDYWCASQIKNILTNPIYYGEIQYPKWKRTIDNKKVKVPLEERIVVKGDFPPIIDKITFDKAQEVRKKRNKFNGRALGSRYFLSGILKCGYCGRNMIFYKSGWYHGYYVCGGWHQSGICTKNPFRREQLEEIILNDINRLIKNPEVLKGYNKKVSEDNLDNIENELEQNKKELLKFDGRRRKLFRMAEDNIITNDKFKERLIELEEEKNALENRIMTLRGEKEAKLSQELNKNSFQEVLKKFKKVFYKAEINLQKEMLRSLIDKIVIKDKQASIFYNLQ